MPADPSPLRADVARVDFGACVLLCDDGSLLRATVRGRLMGPRKALGNAVVVGDRAGYEQASDAATDAVITEVEPRRNAFSRRAAGRQAAEQVVAANLDQVVLVTSVAEPVFSPGLADRVLCQAERAGIPARIALNKCDLAAHQPGGDLAPAILEDYARAGYAGHAVSALSGRGLAELGKACEGRRSLFVGHSGVGKSTLLNAMRPGLDLLAGRVNDRTGRGRHTTTAAWLLRPGPGFEVVDTPGVRAFGLWGVDPAELDQVYPEFGPYRGECRFADCAHQTEPGCALRAAVEAGRIPRRRYESFLKLRDELVADAAGAPRAGWQA